MGFTLQYLRMIDSSFYEQMERFNKILWKEIKKDMDKNKLIEKIENLEKELEATKKELNKPEIGISWEELEQEYIRNQKSLSDIPECFTNQPEIEALRKLIWLRDSKYYNDGWKPDWTDSYEKCIIYMRSNGIIKSHATYSFEHLAFKSEEIRDVFYDNHLDLIKEAYGIEG